MVVMLADTDELDEDEFLTVPEAATLIKLGASTLHRHLANGTVPGRVVFGRAVRVHQPTFLGWARRQASCTVLRGDE